MDHVGAEQQRNAKTRFLDRDLLHTAVPAGARAVKQRADEALADRISLLGLIELNLVGIGRRRGGARTRRGQTGQLPSLLLERHVANQGVD